MGKETSDNLDSAEETQGDSTLPIVIIGGSAGCLEPIETIMGDPAISTEATYVIVTHQAPKWGSLLAEIIEQNTKLDIEPNYAGQEMLPGHVYLYDSFLAAGSEGERRKDENKPLDHNIVLPIDHLLNEFSTAYKERVVAVILAGMGSDGAIGAMSVKENGGIVLAQDPLSCEYPSMPQAAIDKGYVDYVVHPDEVALKVAEVIEARSTLSRETFGDPHLLVNSDPASLSTMFELLIRRTGCDFSLYKEGTISRRLARRMSLKGTRTLAAYIELITHDKTELDQLFRELLVDVTYFFREPEAFESLINNALKNSLRSIKKGQTFRVWVPACSTGEEAFSLAIAINELMEKEAIQVPLVIFATDMSDSAIDCARRSVYPEGIREDVPGEILSKYFVNKGDHYQIAPNIREQVIFARQNLINDPPFTKLDLISCRNLLIYIRSETQRRLMSVFHFALKSNGILFLGASESVTAHEQLFTAIDSKNKIFRRRDVLLPTDVPIAVTSATGWQPYHSSQYATQQSLGARHLRLDRVVGDILLRRYAPPSVLVTAEGQFLYLHGKTGEFLEPPEGHAKMTLLEMAKPGLRKELVSAMNLADKKDGPVSIDDIVLDAEGSYISVDMVVTGFKQPEALSGLYLVSFIKKVREFLKQSQTADENISDDKSDESITTVDALRNELLKTKDSLQLAVQQKDWLVQDLQASNEELQSTNEELQSTNEELETSREELQSMNEELTTINAELERRVTQLFVSNDDMENLLNSIDVATIFLDGNLSIKRFTNQARAVINIRDTDIGRPISEITSKIEFRRLIAEAEQVLMTLAPFESEVRSSDGQYYLLRILAYRTSKNMIDGVVITFVNINRIKELETTKSANENIVAIMQAAKEPMLMLDENLCYMSGNASFHGLLDTTRNYLGKPIYDIGVLIFQAEGFVDSVEQVQFGIESTIVRSFKYVDGKSEYSSEVSIVRLKTDAEADAKVLIVVHATRST